MANLKLEINTEPTLYVWLCSSHAQYTRIKCFLLLWILIQHQGIKMKHKEMEISGGVSIQKIRNPV
uniref:Uncharacterized protein n=1 Tax=Arundo donax TaxID=35708 RepID=A0A0A9BH74_ARUDO